MKNSPFFFILGVLALTSPALGAHAKEKAQNNYEPKIKQKWAVEGFEQPESALYDADNKIIYISNIKGSPIEKDGNGYISKLSSSGKVIKKDWVTGLDAPKGMALQNGHLFVSDIDSVVEIDAHSGKIISKHAIKGSVFLNDIIANAEHVFVSDMLANKIHVKIGDGAFELVKTKTPLDYPNGLTFYDGRLIIANWGKPAKDFSTQFPGHVTQLDPATGKVVAVGDAKPLGNLDGIVDDAKSGFWLTDWMKGEIIFFTHEGGKSRRFKAEKGTADLGIIANKRLLLVPIMATGKLVAYKIK